ncbi:50S ribosomal protein L25 [Candidatus Saccharibacteria bacterium]|nr:50S ribosomal protein L25 [Candidatus Saccharibacteria bacterium]
MAEYKLKLKNRELTGKKLTALRNEGMIPSVVYGGKAPILTASFYVETEKVLEKAGYHSPIDLDIEGKKRIAIVKNVAFNPVSRRIINIEFLAVSAKEAVEATTPIVAMNFEQSEAAKTFHYVLSQQIDEIDVKAKPSDLPKELTVDAANLKELDDKLTIADIKLPEGVEFADKELDMEQVVVSLYDPAAEAEKREAEEKAAAEAASEETPAESGDAKPEGNAEEAA